MRLPIIMTCVMSLGLGACETMQAAKQERPIEFTSSDYCQIARKRTWSVDDTKASIDEARRENAKWDRLCGPTAKVS